MNCPLCDNNSAIIYENKNMPYGMGLNNKTINLSVSLCRACNFVFQSSAYTKKYDEEIKELYSSYKISDIYDFPNRNYHNIKALTFLEDIIENNINYNVLEIGSNRGDFLYLLKEKFPQINILGCEPTEFKMLKVPTLNAFFDKNLFNTKFDLIILRHTLEHIKNPHLFIEELIAISNKNTKIFIEVPNIIYSLNNYIEDFTPDHVNYFCSQTLTSLFSAYNTTKLDDKEYLYALFDKSSKKEVKNSVPTQNIELLFNKYNKKIKEIQELLSKYERIIFYGISNYYLWTYYKFEDIVKEKELYFIDDNLYEDKLFNLKKLTSFKKNDLVILCSSNLKVQEKMKNNLPKDIDILYLWKGIGNV